MPAHKRLERLWDLTPWAQARFNPDTLTLPARAERWLAGAVLSGTPLYRAVRMKMEGEIRLEGEWCPFEAEEVIRPDHGFVWAATVKVNGIPVKGFDEFHDGEGRMHWDMLGIFPIVNAHDDDVTRSALGRFHAESLWLPTWLAHEDVLWEDTEDGIAVSVRSHGAETWIELELNDADNLRGFRMQRWGGPDGHAGRDVAFGGEFSSVRRFDGVSIPYEGRIGWHFGEARFDDDGEFFRFRVTDARFR